jgi:hypothetical protein
VRPHKNIERFVLAFGRMLVLLRYAAFLTQRSHFAAVLLDRPFEIRHRDE